MTVLESTEPADVGGDTGTIQVFVGSNLHGSVELHRTVISQGMFQDETPVLDGKLLCFE